MRYVIAAVIAGTLSGCGVLKTYKADRQLGMDVRKFITKSVDGNVDCPSACEALKAYIKARYGI